MFNGIREKAGIKTGTFHDLRRTDLVDKARRATKHRVSREMLERCLGRE